jgi:hypothetical protein
MPAVTALLARQPLSDGKLALCWQVVVGSTLARAVTVTRLEGTTLVVAAADAHWAREVRHASRDILTRLRPLLGAATVTRVRVEIRS